jgi:hypothetical protein
VRRGVPRGDIMTKQSNISLVQKIVSIALGLALFMLLIWGGYRLITLFIGYFSNLDKTVAVAIVAGSVTVLTSTLTVVLGRYFESKRDRDAAHREKKTELYNEFLGKLFSLFLADDEQKRKEEDLVPFLREIQRKLILWSGPDVVKAYADWHGILRTQGSAPGAKSMIKMVDFFLALRGDLGHSNKGIKRDHLVSFMLKNPELFMEMYRKNSDVSFEEIAAKEKEITSGS